MGALKITGQSAAPTVTASDAGMIYYDSIAKVLKVYNGASWENLSQDDKIRQDVTTLALRQAIGDNAIAYNLPNSFIDQFEDDSGVGPSSGAGSVGNTIFRNYADECLSPQDSWSEPAWVTTTRTDIQVTSGVSWENEGTAYDAMEENFFDYSGSYFTAPGPDGTDIYPSSQYTDPNVLTMYFGGSFANRISGYRFSASSANGGGITIEGCVQGSNSIGSGYVDLSGFINRFNAGGGTSFLSTLPGGATTQEITWENETVYQYIKFLKTSGTLTSSGSWYGFQFRESIPSTTFTTGDGLIISKTSVPTTAQTKVSGVMLYKDAGSGASTIGTDLQIWFTCNGSDYVQAASYTEVTPVFSTGIKMVKLGETICTSGSDVKYKAVWANQASGSKVTELHGIGLNY